MTNWQFDDGPVAIGIDIGWSKSKKSCALAVEGLIAPPKTKDWTRYLRDGRSLAVGLFFYSDLLPTLRKMIGSIPRGTRLSVVVDGPIGPKGRPTENRRVDSEFMRGEFNRRMQPSPVSQGQGPRYTEVTDEVVRSVHEASGVEYRPGLWDGKPTTGLTVCETHPTVGLAILLPKQSRPTLPTRKSPKPIKVAGSNFKFCNAKSDWYWHLGAGRWIAEEALKCPSITTESDHERVAGLYCLGVASLLASDPKLVMAVGDADGVYVFPAVIDHAWLNDIRTVGIEVGTPETRDQSEYVANADREVFVVANTPETADEEFDDPDEWGKGDQTELILNDTGGVWLQHNDWLQGLEQPVVVRSDDDFQEVAEFRLSLRPENDQWVAILPNQKPLQLARRRGFAGGHLSNDRIWVIPITVVSSGGGSTSDK